VRGGQLWSPGPVPGLCAAHHTRWVSRARPDLSAFVAAAAPVRAGKSRADEVFDLSTLPLRCRLEIAFVLQRRHDGRGRDCATRRVAGRGDARPIRCRLVALLPLDAWLAALPPANKTAEASAVGFLRYAWREVEDVMAGGGWRPSTHVTHGTPAPRHPVTVGHHSVSFAAFPRHGYASGEVLGEVSPRRGDLLRGDPRDVTGSPGSPAFSRRAARMRATPR